MRFSRLLGSLLVVVGNDKNERPSSTTWLIDGNNLKAQSKVPSERQILALKLKPLTEPSTRNYATNVALVFDGRRGEASSSFETNLSDDGGGIFLTVITPDFQTADDYIVKALEQEEFGIGRVHVVTADRELQHRVVATKQMNGGAVIHPVKFWRDHLPSLTARDGKKGKKDGNNQPKA
jgi:predicted RNA-binding protein with PIN domain